MYRRLLRIPRTKPEENRADFREYITTNFRSQAGKIDKKDVATVEYLVRRGTSSANMLERPDVKKISIRK